MWWSDVVTVMWWSDVVTVMWWYAVVITLGRSYRMLWCVNVFQVIRSSGFIGDHMSWWLYCGRYKVMIVLCCDCHAYHFVLISCGVIVLGGGGGLTWRWYWRDVMSWYYSKYGDIIRGNVLWRLYSRWTDVVFVQSDTWWWLYELIIMFRRDMLSKWYKISVLWLRHNSMY